MNPMQIIFLVVAAITLFAGVLVVSTRNLVHSALWLILALFGVAVLFALLSAGFLAIVQVVIYIGAISILLIFAIMLTRKVAEDQGPQVNSNWPWAVMLAVVMCGGLIWMLKDWQGFSAAAPAPLQGDSLTQLGLALVSPNAYVLPFEVASVLLLAALVGAIIVAWDRK